MFSLEQVPRAQSRCRVQPGASMEDLEAAEFVGSVPDELITPWTASRESWLFKDTEYGQWGLHLLSPGDCAARTSVERVRRPGDSRSDDIVWESFAVTRTCLSIPVRRCPCVAFLLCCHWIRETSGYQLGTVIDFLGRYLKADGDKFWESYPI